MSINDQNNPTKELQTILSEHTPTELPLGEIPMPKKKQKKSNRDFLLRYRATADDSHNHDNGFARVFVTELKFCCAPMSRSWNRFVEASALYGEPRVFSRAALAVGRFEEAYLASAVASADEVTGFNCDADQEDIVSYPPDPHDYCSSCGATIVIEKDE